MIKNSDTFKNCTNLTEIVGINNCTSLTEVTIPDSVKTISMYAFNKCTNLTSVIYKGTTYTTKSSLPSALKANGVKCDLNAFNNAGLK